MANKKYAFLIGFSSVMFIGSVLRIKKNIEEYNFIKDETKIKSLESWAKFYEGVINEFEPNNKYNKELTELKNELNEINNFIDDEKKKFYKKYYKRFEAN